MILDEAIRDSRQRRDLDAKTVPSIVADLLNPKAPAQLKKEFLEALSEKGESVSELVAFAEAFLPHAVHPGFQETWNGKPLFDCCGTGGGGVPLINISTGIMFILAACGVPVVKHGNRGMTKKSGSADVLEALGISIDLDPVALRECMERLGMGFLFAPHYHPAFSVIAPVRRELGAAGKRTIFNLLGPLLNPARPTRQIVGVFQKAHLDLFHAALQARGVDGIVVYGMHGDAQPIGEVSVTGANLFRGSRAETLRSLMSTVLTGVAFETLLAPTAQESAARLVAILSCEERGLARELLLINAAVALIAHGTACTLEEARATACEALDSHRAFQKLRAWQNLRLKSRPIRDKL